VHQAVTGQIWICIGAVLQLEQKLWIARHHGSITRPVVQGRRSSGCDLQTGGRHQKVRLPPVRPGVSTSPPQHSRPTQAKAQQGSEQPGVIIQHAPKSCVRQRASIGWPALINLALPFQCPLPAARCPWRARAEPRDNVVAFKVACVDHCAM
jgi:hypothetical protein